MLTIGSSDLCLDQKVWKPSGQDHNGLPSMQQQHCHLSWDLVPLLRVRFHLILKSVPSDPITSLNLKSRWKDAQDKRPLLEAVVTVFYQYKQQTTLELAQGPPTELTEASV